MTMSRAPVTLWPQPTGCRISQTSTLLYVCRKPVSTLEFLWWWFSLHCTLYGGCNDSGAYFSGLRQDYVSTPAAAASPSRRGPGARLMLPSHFNTAVENTDDFIPGNQTEASSSSCWQPGLSSLTSSSCQPPTSEAKRGFQIPKLARLHQQVTQFKLLKLAQTQGAQTWYSSSHCLCFWSDSCKHFVFYFRKDLAVLLEARMGVKEGMNDFLVWLCEKERTFCSSVEDI